VLNSTITSWWCTISILGHPSSPRGLELVLLPLRQEAVDGICSSSLLQRLQEVMVCQVASATSSLINALNASPWCLQRTLNPEKISTTASNSTCPGRRTPLILYLKTEVMPKSPSRARSLPVGTGASATKDSLSSASLYSFSPSLSLREEYSLSSSSLLLTLWSCCCSLAGVP
jgi:hypothetical protein